LGIDGSHSDLSPLGECCFQANPVFLIAISAPGLQNRITMPPAARTWF
jgi:hypothetical protein